MSLFPPAEELLSPHAFYRVRRHERPVAYDEAMQAWAVYRYPEVKTVLMDHQAFSSQRLASQEAEGFRESLISMDPPRHRQLRGLISKAFTPRAINDMVPRIEALTRELLDAIEEGGRLELVNDLAHPLPVIVIAEMLGVPPADRPQYKRWADELLSGTTNLLERREEALERGRRVQAEMDAYFQAIIEERRKRPREDLISHLLSAELEGERLSEEGVLSFCALLLLAGHITTVNLITNGMLCLLDHPDQMRHLRTHPEDMMSAIEEMLRYRSPVQWTARAATRDMELGGETIKEGQMVLAFIGSANRDEAVFKEPDRFDVRRDPNPHLSFGHGIHYCIGAPLARLEGAIAMRAMLARLGAIRRDPEAPAALRHIEGGLLHGVAELPLCFEPVRS
ncbi:cytochrome P450 [bacterium]|nr:cytochrome P450 [bacterium]